MSISEPVAGAAAHEWRRRCVFVRRQRRRRQQTKSWRRRQDLTISGRDLFGQSLALLLLAASERACLCRLLFSVVLVH